MQKIVSIDVFFLPLLFILLAVMFTGFPVLPFLIVALSISLIIAIFHLKKVSILGIFAWIFVFLLIYTNVYPLIKERIQMAKCSGLVKVYGTILNEHGRPYSKEYVECVDSMSIKDYRRGLTEV